MAFPTDPLDVRTELQIGGMWTDVSTDTYLRDPITISRGRADEASRPDHSTATVTFNNRNGQYSPRNPIGTHYGLIGRNTPIRISAPTGVTRLELDGSTGVYATTPNTAALDLTGDLDVRAEVHIDWHSPGDPQTIMGRWGTVAADQSWLLRVTGGALELDWTNSVDGFQYFAAAAVPDELPAHAAVRATLDVNNGAGGYTVALYWADTIAGPWTQFYGGSTAGSMAVLPGTADLRGSPLDNSTSPNGQPFAGYAYAIEVRNGIGGTMVANADFTAQAAGATAFTDGAGRAWTVVGTAITEMSYRFTGEVSAWPPKWDVSGNDRYTPVSAAGPMRRYGAGTDPLQSTLRRRIPSDTSVLAYWPLEDGTAATQAASGLPSGQAATLTGVSWAADSTLPGSSPLPTLGATGTFSGTVPAPAGSTSGWHVEFVLHQTTAPTASTPLLTIATTGTAAEVRITYETTGPKVAGYDGAGNQLWATATMGIPANWARIAVYTTISGSTVTLTAKGTIIGGGGGTLTQTYTGTTGVVTRVYSAFGSFGPGLQGASIGHIGVFSNPGTGIYDFADTGFDGELAGVRIARLCQEQGVPILFTHGIGPTAAMGPQRPAAFLDLLNECADVDMGILHEDRTASRLAYRRRESLENQAAALALDYAVDGHVAPPLEPVDDDQATRNRITVARTNGSSVTVQEDTGALSVQLPPDGIGPTAPGGGTYNVQTDDQLPDMAGWLLHLGTWDDARYPSVHVDLAAAPGLIPTAAAVDVADRITIAHPPPEAGGAGDTLDQLGQGYTETLGSYDWDLVFNCSPGAPWKTAVLDDPVLGRADTDGSQLAVGVNATATTLQVAVTAGPLWTTDPAEFPLDVRMGGEVMTVTSITGTTSPQTWHVTRSVNGVVKPQTAGTDVRLATPMILAL